MKMSGISGQALTEFTATLGIWASAWAAATLLFLGTWKRWSCMREVYERTHQTLYQIDQDTQLTSKLRTIHSGRVRITVTPDWIEGESSCPGSIEKLRLLRLNRMEFSPQDSSSSWKNLLNAGGELLRQKMPSLNEEGSLTLPLVLMISTILCGGLGVSKLFSDWSARVQTQFTLEECTGRTAIEFRETSQRIHQANQIISVSRGIQMSSVLFSPPVVALAKSTGKAASIYQEALLLKWKLKKTQWLSGFSCPEAGYLLPAKLPALPWSTEPPDIWGSQPLKFDPPATLSWTFELRKGSVLAQASLKTNPSHLISVDRIIYGSSTPTSWHAFWGKGKNALRTSSR